MIVLLAGLYSLLFGRITVRYGRTLRGSFARLYGLTLLIIAIPYLLFFDVALVIISPNLVSLDSVVGMLLRIFIMIAIVIALEQPFFIWQQGTSSSMQNVVSSKKGRISAIVAPLLGLLLLIGAAGGYAAIQFRMKNSGKAVIEASNSAKRDGYDFGSHHDPNECLGKTLTRMTDDIAGTENVAALSFLSECLKATGRSSEWCKLLPHEDSARLLWAESQCRSTKLNPYLCRSRVSVASHLSCEDVLLPQDPSKSSWS